MHLFCVWLIVIYLKFIISCSCVCVFFFSVFLGPCATCSTCIVFRSVRYFPPSNFPLHDAFTSHRTFPTTYKLMVLIVTCFRGSLSMETRETTNQNLRMWVISRFVLKMMFIGIEIGYKTYVMFFNFIKFYAVLPPPNNLRSFASLYRCADKSLARPGRKQANVSVRQE